MIRLNNNTLLEHLLIMVSHKIIKKIRLQIFDLKPNTPSKKNIMPLHIPILRKRKVIPAPVVFRHN